MYSRAVYSPQKIKLFRGNPRIEALDEYISDKKKLKKILRVIPDIDEEELSLPVEERCLLLHASIKDFYQPRGYDFILYDRLQTMMRTGYVGKNPFQNQIEEKVEGITYVRENKISTSDVLVIIGDSGIGKSTMVNKFSALVKPVIEHVEYNGQAWLEYQAPILMIEIPPNGSIKGMCYDLLGELDNLLGGEKKYRSKILKKNTNYIMGDVKEKIKLHGVGLIIVDEIQHLKGIKQEQPDELINFFLYLTNQFKVPMVFIGTNEAEGLFSTTLRALRRAGSIWRLERFKMDEEWRIFVKSLFKIQYNHNHIEATEEMIQYLYRLTQGFTGFAIDLFVSAQEKAIRSGLETITKELLVQAIVEDYPDRIPIVEGIRTKTNETLANYRDISLFEEDKIEDKVVEQNEDKVVSKEQEEMVTMILEYAKQGKSAYEILYETNNIKDASEFK